jgi:hypothetical protein
MPEKNYTVTRKEPVRQMTPDMQVSTLWRLHAISRGGTYFWVEVKDMELDQADAKLTAKAKQIDAIV